MLYFAQIIVLPIFFYEGGWGGVQMMIDMMVKMGEMKVDEIFNDKMVGILRYNWMRWSDGQFNLCFKEKLDDSMYQGYEYLCAVC